MPNSLQVQFILTIYNPETAAATETRLQIGEDTREIYQSNTDNTLLECYNSNLRIPTSISSKLSQLSTHSSYPSIIMSDTYEESWSW